MADTPSDLTAAPARPRPLRPAPADAPPPARRAPATRVKICGITRFDDALHAVEAGAWAIGMIFWPGSRRRIAVEEAQAIGAALKRQAEVAGVFVNAPLDEIERLADACQMTIVQLHGDEGPQFCAEVARRTGAKVIKAARVRNGADVTALRPFHTDFHLLDTYVDGTPGGTGATFDWELARVRRAAVGERQPKLILSGGLRVDNVADAVRATWPFAVDVAGGTEASPGRKEPALVEAFIAAAASARDEQPAEGEADEPAPAPAAEAAPEPGTPDPAPTAEGHDR
ncbi:phosphoribosylanthranilate isomerase [Patulibacter defluvii]|uniref:phosphoribosylanthranilate isomerase n=1 Tax=Patulibacter defluvii TaxID=3095358 RepID=UPI002A749351|nr:phosphoribosylanthranilate isomerase [Patulibacter sp. DM4]